MQFAARLNPGYVRCSNRSGRTTSVDLEKKQAAFGKLVFRRLPAFSDLSGASGQNYLALNSTAAVVRLQPSTRFSTMAVSVPMFSAGEAGQSRTAEQYSPEAECS